MVSDWGYRSGRSRKHSVSGPRWQHHSPLASATRRNGSNDQLSPVSTKELCDMCLGAIKSARAFGILALSLISMTTPQAATDSQREARIESILRQLTLDEKISLVSGAATFSTASVERLGIRGMRFTDGPYGVRSNDSDPATVFPVGIALAATWHPELVGDVGKAIGEETRAMGAQVLLGPNLNLVRSPLSGRNFETYGEDPQLAAQLGVSFVKGVQSVGVAATPKHYVGN